MKGAAPGTGEQYHTVASDKADNKPSSLVLNGTRWYVGREYWDSEMNDIAVLSVIMSKSSWCDTRDAENCPPKLVFNYKRREISEMKIDPNSPDADASERFQPRYRRPDPRP